VNEASEKEGTVGSWLLLAVCAFAWGCSTHPPLGARSDGIIVGTDDRVELADVAPPAQRILRQSTVAITPGHRMLLDGSQALRINAPTLQEAEGLCDGEPFAEQPTAASCSGVLIDDDLVLTAGHCLGQGTADATEACRKWRIVFGYGYLEKPELELSPEELFFCRRVVTQGLAPDDFLVFQLDRAVRAPWAPAPLTRAIPAAGATLLVASNGAGLPLKVEQHASVTSVFGHYLIAETDTFAGSSGGPLYDFELNVVALVQRGGIDWESTETCTRAARVEHGTEHHQLVAPAWDALCASLWPSASLCGIEPRCGDGICNAQETPVGCALDCEPPRCGDGLCELDERDSCQLDCHAYDAVPANVSAPERYGERLTATNQDHPTGGCSITRDDVPLTSTLTRWGVAVLLTLFCWRRFVRAHSGQPTYWARVDGS